LATSLSVRRFVDVVGLKGWDYTAVIGYYNHDAHNVRLFLTESFTFRVLDAQAFVRLEA
jgi:uncharacterized linocin/CFP29 family protein